jgi:hypothetical protein
MTNQLSPQKVAYIAPGVVKVDMKTEAGDAVSFTMQTSALLSLIRLSTDLLNNYSSGVLRDLGVL